MNLDKCIKNKKVAVAIEEPKDADMQKAPIKKEGISAYDIHTNEDRLRYFFIQEKLMKLIEATKLANVNLENARTWKRAYENDPEQKVPLKRTHRTSKRAPSQLNEKHKEHLINFFNENCTAVI